MSENLILIIEDETKIALVLKDYLEQSGYRTHCLYRGDAAIPFVRKQRPALILLDLMLPGMDGVEICREIRKFSTVPIIMITARVEETDRIVGLELGADDYICKPFSPREVVARVKAVLRRAYPLETDGETILTAGPIQLDEEARQVTINGNPIRPTPTEYQLLRLMLKRPGRVFSRAELIQQVQGYSFDGYDRTVDSHIKNLRRKIGEFADGEVILSVYGVGYKIG